MGGALVFVAADRTLRMIGSILDSRDDSCLEGLIVLGQFLDTLIGSFAVW